MFSFQVFGNDCVRLASSFFESKKLSQSEGRLLGHAQLLKYSDEEIFLIKESLGKLTEISPRLVRSYLTYALSFDNVNRRLALTLIPEMMNRESDSPILKKFWKTQAKLDHYELGARKKFEKKFKTEKVAALARDERYLYEKINYNCMARQWNPERVSAMKYYQKFVFGIGITSGSLSYTYNHFDEEKNFKWFGNLGYDISMGLFFSYMKSKIITNPKTGIVAKGIQKWFTQRGFAVIDIVAYPMLFGPSNSDEQTKLDMVLNNPDYQEEINRLLTHFEDQRFYQEVKGSLIEALNRVLPEGRSIITAPKDIEDIDWANLKKEDLKREDVQDIILAAILMEYYEQSKGNLIVTGQRGIDRYVFHAGYSALFAVKDMPLDLWIYNTLCTGVLNPKLAMFKALGIYTIDKVVFDQVYYSFRRESINM